MKIKLFSIIVAVLFLLTGCSGKPDRTMPSVLLNEAQMVDVMVDVQIMESAISYKRNSNGKTEYLKTRGFDTVFSHHGITDSIFKENITYYSEDPTTMLRIMDSVVVELQRCRADNDSTLKNK